MLRDSFGKKYDWARQIKDLIEKMISWVHGENFNLIDSCIPSCIYIGQ